MGLPLGGVWKTTSAGTTWYPIFDDVKEASSVGSIEVAPSDPTVIYVGMGDQVPGGGIHEGNGVYKSVDAGKTWIHLGLEDTKRIPSILVDPHDPNLVMIAAQGNLHSMSDSRGVFRSTDGGKSWKRTLFLDKLTGFQKLASAPDIPSVILATSVRHYFPAGSNRRIQAGGTTPPAPVSAGTKLFKSTDEGLTWTELKGGGLPQMSGRTCVAVAQGTKGQRMFLVGGFGLYRSDDGGTTWKHMDASDQRVRNGQGGYNCGIYVNPQNPDTVYLINTCSYISTDGGNSFTGFKGAPGGDDPQQMWLDPTDGKRLFLGTDQGGTVSLDGGLNWSSWYNQPTAQVYHISTDNQFPYWIYATQQDSGSIATASRGNFGAITPLDWLPHPGYEFGSIVADPRDAKISYAGGPTGGIIKTTYPSGQWIDVSPSVNSADTLRRVGNQPLAFSPVNPRELLVGFQYLMATTDGGKSWHKLSPDLGFPKGYVPPKPATTPAIAKPAGGSVAVISDEDPDEMEFDADAGPQEQAGPIGGGSIESFSVSTVDKGVIWVGTNNGLVKVTRDHGKTWEDVTIPGLPNPTRADISSIDASHQDAGTAFLVIDYHNLADFAPYVYRTKDFGKTWAKVVTGLPVDQPSGSFARVVRADTVKSGLVFVGTESSMYVSFDAGDHWQSLMLNLPNTSYRDMSINGNDLVVGTYGRSFWILDDISPLREITASLPGQAAHLFKPGDAVRVRRNVNGDTPYPPEVPQALNPPAGAIIYYFLAKPSKGPVELDVTDAAGRLISHRTSAGLPPAVEAFPPVPNFWLERPQPLPAAAGTNRINWNLRYDSPPSFSKSYEINANPGMTPATPEGPLVAPGVYTVTLTAFGSTYRQTVTVRNDPRSPASKHDVAVQCDWQRQLYEGAAEAWRGYQAISYLRKSMTEVTKGSKDTDLVKAATAFDEKLLTIGGSPRGGRRGGPRGAPSAIPPPSFARINSTMIQHINALDSGDMAPNEPWRKTLTSAVAELKAAREAWKLFQEKDLKTFNDLLAQKHLKALSMVASPE